MLSWLQLNSITEANSLIGFSPIKVIGPRLGPLGPIVHCLHSLPPRSNRRNDSLAEECRFDALFGTPRHFALIPIGELLLVGVGYCVGKGIIMFGTAIRLFAKKPKPPMKPIELGMLPEQTQTVTRVIFDILKEHGPLTVGDTWERVKVVGLRGLTSKRHMKIVMRWMRERQKLKLICNHVGPHKQFLYTTWFTKVQKPKERPDTSRPKLP